MIISYTIANNDNTKVIIVTTPEPSAKLPTDFQSVVSLSLTVLARIVLIPTEKINIVIKEITKPLLIISPPKAVIYRRRLRIAVMSAQ